MQIAKPSVMSLFVQMRVDGNTLGTGTAFVAPSKKGPVLLTNWHIVAGKDPQTGQVLSKTGGIPDEIVVVHNRAGSLGSWVERHEPLYANDSPRWVEHPTLGRNVDCVALPLTAVSDVDLYPHELNDSAPAISCGPADAVSVVGFPFGLTSGGALAVWATGFIASERHADFNSLPCFLIDCRSRQGQSGSPVIAYRSGGMVALEDGGSVVRTGPVWRLLGIYSGRVNSESDLGIVWKTIALREIVAAV